MEESERSGSTVRAARKVGIHRNTASKYLRAGQLPSAMVKPRHWRTRPDVFADAWESLVVPCVQDAPELEAKTIFEHLVSLQPGKYEPGQVRTLQRRLREWRAEFGPPREVMFVQEHRPGEAMQTDFTWVIDPSIAITIQGEPFRHMLSHSVLPYSNWEWATVCQSESLVAIRAGVQAAIFKLGRTPEWHQTDNSTAATHTMPDKSRKFNPEYEALMRHLSMKPRTIEAGKKNQNGDVEALNGALKRRLVQHLAMRGSRDFQSIREYEAWLEGVLEKANSLRQTKLAEELAVMRELQVKRLAEFREIDDVLVTAWSTIRVLRNAYSVPSRLMGERVTVRVYVDRLEVLYLGRVQATLERMLGEGGHRISYRDVIWSLVQKPGAFRNYKYRGDLFPTVEFRRAYDKLLEHLPERRADIEYLRVLNLAASTMQSEVEVALVLLHEHGQVATHEAVTSLVKPQKATTPELAPLIPDLSPYDALLMCVMEA